MTKTITLTAVLCAAMATATLAQKADSAAAAARRADYLSTYRKALQYDDLSSAAYALVNVLKDGGEAQFRDTLAVIYYRMGNMGGAYKMAKEVHESDAKDITALTLLADISARAGENKTSLDWYEKLCAVQPDPYNFYQLATRQFVQERVGECRQSLMTVVKDSTKAREAQVAMEIQPGNSENVPVLAAAYNMLGVLAYKEKNTAEARKYYEQALKVHPPFAIARQNLEGLTPNKPASTAKPAAKPKS